MNSKIHGLIFLTLAATLLISCSEKSEAKYIYKNYKYLNAPKQKKQLQTVIIKNRKLIYPSVIGLLQDYIIVADEKSENMITILSEKDGKTVASFGKFGKGPGDFVGPADIVQCALSKDCFWIYDISSLNMKKFNIKTILEGNYEPEKIITFKLGKVFPDN